jgi:small-conductance mechanosensitive channel
MFGRVFLRSVLGALLAISVAGSASGQSGAAPQVRPSAAVTEIPTGDLKALVGALENDAERQKLISELKALIAAREQPSAGPSQPAPTAAETDGGTGALVIAGISDRVRAMSASLADAAGTVFDFPRLLDWASRQASDADARAAWLAFFAKLLAVLALAVAAERVVTFGLRRTRGIVADRQGAPVWLRLALRAARIVIDLVPVAGFAAVAYCVLPFAHPDDYVSITVVSVVHATVIVRAAVIVADALLAPQAPTVRLLGMSGETASYWFVWLRRLVGLAVCGYIGADAALLMGLPAGVYEVVTRLLGLALASLAVVLILQNRDAVARWIRGTPAAERASGLRILRARLAEIWHVVALVYVAAIYVVWALHVPGGFDSVVRGTVVSVLVLIAARGLDGAGEALVQRFFAISPELKRRFPGLERRADRYLAVFEQVLRILTYLVTTMILLWAWGFRSFDWVSSDPGRHIIGGLVTIVIAALAGLLTWEAISLAIEYYLARHVTGSALERRQRARTLLPLLRRVAAIILVAMVGLITLSELGVNIAPLLAGAGIVGIAVGFGAQNLVRDIITGLFILFEDTIAVGDVVAVGEDNGVVEALSIRDLRLRDANGAVHTIPFSAVTKVVNMTKDFAYANFAIAVGYNEDIDVAIAAIESLGKEFVADREFRDAVIGNFDPVVVVKFSENAVVLHTQIKTLPGQQWNVAPAFNLRLKRRFDQFGITMYPSRKIYLSPEVQRSSRLEAPMGRANSELVTRRNRSR